MNISHSECRSRWRQAGASWRLRYKCFGAQWRPRVGLVRFCWLFLRPVETNESSLFWLLLRQWSEVITTSLPNIHLRGRGDNHPEIVQVPASLRKATWWWAPALICPGGGHPPHPGDGHNGWSFGRNFRKKREQSFSTRVMKDQRLRRACVQSYASQWVLRVLSRDWRKIFLVYGRKGNCPCCVPGWK